MSRGSEETNLIQHLCQRRKVLVIGDVVLEKFIHTFTTRSSVSVPVYEEKNVSCRLGCCGNVALNLQNLGVEVSLMTPVNPKGNICELLVKNGISTEALLQCSCQDLTHTRYIASGHLSYQVNSLPLDERQPWESFEGKICTYLEKNLTNFDCLVVSDTEGSSLGDEIVQKIIKSAKKASIPVVVDSRRCQHRKFEGATLILENITGHSYDMETEDEARFGALRQNCKKLQIEECIALSRNDLFIVRDEGLMKVPMTHLHQPAAGGYEDTVVACLAFGKANHLALLESSKLAKYAVQSLNFQLETSPLDLVSILKFYSKVLTSPTQERFLGELLRKNDKKIAFMSGCFDIMHRGHINILRRAKEQADILVVGLNSDASVKLLKGNKRPLCSLEDRLAVLKCISYCDFIAVFDERTPAKILASLQPDVLVKGDDYPESHVRAMFPEMDHFAILPRTPGISTTDLIRKMSQS